MKMDMLTLRLHHNLGMRDARVEFERAAALWRSVAAVLAGCVVILLWVIAVIG